MLIFSKALAGWSSGTGGAGIFGSMFYLAARSWFKMTPFIALLIGSIFPFFMAFVYGFGTKRPERTATINDGIGLLIC